jgi:hypothetical protein
VNACREFIDLTNRHVGAYVDACAGFAGNKARVELQAARILHRQGSKPERKDGSVVVLASFEDPDRPDAIHHRIVAAKEFIDANSESGSNAQMHAFSAIVFLFAKWDEVIRPRLAAAKGVECNTITLDIMGDIRQLRIAILHNDGILSDTAHAKLRCLQGIVQSGKLSISNDVIHFIFAQIKTGSAELMLNHLGLPAPKTGPDAIREIALPRSAKRYQFRG